MTAEGNNSEALPLLLKEKAMKSMLQYLFPGLMRFERERQNFERYIPTLLVILAIAYFMIDFFTAPHQLYYIILWRALRKALMLYFCYLLMIELSPDHKQGYRISFVLIASVIALPITKAHSLSTLFFLCSTRILTKSSGYLTTRWELLLMTLFMGLMFIISPFIYPLLFGITLLLDYQFKHKDYRNVPFIFISILMSLMWVKNGFGIVTHPLNSLGTTIVFVVTVLYIFRLSLLKQVLSLNDTRTNLISPKRVKAAGILLLVSLIIMALGHDELYENLHHWTMLGCISFPYMKDIRKIFLRSD